MQEDLQLPYWATGDILRAAVRDGTELGSAPGPITLEAEKAFAAIVARELGDG